MQSVHVIGHLDKVSLSHEIVLHQEFALQRDDTMAARGFFGRIN
jgi:RNA-binding protein YlmH